MARVQVNVTGHRVRRDVVVRDEGLREQLQAFSAAFGEALAEQVGLRVSGLIGKGQWWASRNPRFAAYRSWVKLRYGSDRRRKMAGSRMREATNAQSRADLDEADMNQWGNVQHLMTRWLVRKLKAASVRSDSRRGTRVYITSRTTGSGPIEVTAALNYLERVLRTNQSLKDGAVLDARERRLRNLEQLMSEGNASLRALKGSRYGQRLYRMAELEAIRELRERQARKETSGLNARQRRAHNRTGRYIWGVQTGKLRDAWMDATGKTRFDGRKLRVTVTPDNAGDRLPSGLSLTGVLARKITRAGGNPRLLRGTAVRRAVNSALAQVYEEREMHGLHIRLPRSGRR